MTCPKCGNPELWPQLQAYSPQNVQLHSKDRKSMVVGLLLTFFFGPLGLLYVNIKAGLVLTLLTFLLWIPTLGLALVMGWIGSMIWAAVDIDNLNKGQKPLIKDFEQ